MRECDSSSASAADFQAADHGDDGSFSQPLCQIIEFRLAFGQREPPTIVVNDDGHVIGILEGALRSNVASSNLPPIADMLGAVSTAGKCQLRTFVGWLICHNTGGY